MGSLRLFLALCVAFGHFGMPLGFPTSDIAVQSFFVISGFYMALVLNEKYGPGSYWLFISNRLLRLWPTYLVILIPSFVIASNWSPVLSLDLASITGSSPALEGRVGCGARFSSLGRGNWRPSRCVSAILRGPAAC